MEMYIVHLAEEIKPLALGFGKIITNVVKSGEEIMQAISSILTNNDVLIYVITNKGNLHFVNVNVINNKIDTVDTINLGTF
jgi:hypothetical protein